MTMDEQTPDIKPVSPWVMAQTLIEVMQVVADPPRYLRLARLLIQKGCTPDDIARWYGDGGRYWHEDWRGQQGQYPHETAIRETALKYLHDAPVVQAAKAAKSASELDAWMARRGAALDG